MFKWLLSRLPSSPFHKRLARFRPALVFGLVFTLSLLALKMLRVLYGDVLPGLADLNTSLLHEHDLPSHAAQQAIEQIRHQIQWVMLFCCGLGALAAGFITHWVGVARGERAIRAAADALRDEAQAAQREAVKASQDKAKFLGMLSHELLTPLQTILSTLGLIESRGGVQVSEPTFIRLNESVRVLRGRMSDLVDFAKLSVGQLELRVRGFTPVRLLTMLIDDYTEALLEKNLDLHWDPSDELSKRVYSDPTRIRQILENILSNAIKYTDRGGITLHASLVEGPLFRVEISDSGTGISDEQLPHIFDPFYRVKDSAHMAVGSGLGLAVVRSLVDMLQGRIEVHSELGRGSSFVVEIPISLQPVGERRPPDSIRQALAPVLVVDDDAAIRHSMADAIRAMGYEAVEVSNGRTALQEAQSRKFSAIFCDFQLPDVLGIDVVETIRNGQGPNVGTYCVRMSAFHEPDDRSAFLFNARIDKPLDWRQVKEVLRVAQQSAGPAGGA